MKEYVIRKSKGFKFFSLSEILEFKDLLFFMIYRDVSVVYKQTILGFLWAIITPLFSMLIFTIIFGNIVKLNSEGLPYAIFTFSAILPWSYFSSVVSNSSQSIVSNSNLMKKVYFPRIFIPLTSVFSKLFDFFIAFVILIILLIYYQVGVNFNIVYLPLIILTLVFFTSGISMILSSLVVQYRDVKFVLPIVTQLLMYATPVVFSYSVFVKHIGDFSYYLFGIYPLTGVIEGFRSFYLEKEFPLILMLISFTSSVLFFFLGAMVFKSKERNFADVS